MAGAFDDAAGAHALERAGAEGLADGAFAAWILEVLRLLPEEYADDLDAVVLTLLPAQRVKFKRALHQLLKVRSI